MKSIFKRFFSGAAGKKGGKKAPSRKRYIVRG